MSFSPPTFTYAREQIIDSLKRLDINNLQRLNSLLGLGHLQNAITLWEENQNNGNEEFWQELLEKNPYILSQVFSLPVVLFRDKAYIGGKGFSNTGGKIIDFLYTNSLTKNVAMIEIKTPKTHLLSSSYRDGVYPVSPEITGALAQIASYKNTLLRKFDSLINSENDKIEISNPKCLLIAGNMQQEFNKPQQQQSFELFRDTQREVQIITFDELFEKIKMLVNLLEGR